MANLDAYLATHSYLGSEAGATLEDYTQCRGIKPSTLNADSMPHLFRWHTHVSALMKQFPTTTFTGAPLPQGKAPTLGGAGGKAPAAPAQEAKPKEEAKAKEWDKEDKPKQAKPKQEAKPKKEAAPKKEAKKEGDKKEAAPPTPEELEKAKKDKLKKVVKEGGKRGVEIEGAADMGGLQFFCTSMAEPDGDLDLLVESMTAMNAKSNPADEERKGGSGHIGKVIFSAGIEQLAVVAYVPEAKQKELNCEEWITAVLATFKGVIVTKGKDVCTGVVKAREDAFPLKIREPMILEANNFLRKLGLFPEDDSDDDEMVFGDDDFPSM